MVPPDNDDGVVALAGLVQCIENKTNLGIDVRSAGQVGVLEF
jgi:hypothetical protein